MSVEHGDNFVLSLCRDSTMLKFQFDRSRTAHISCSFHFLSANNVSADSRVRLNLNRHPDPVILYLFRLRLGSLSNVSITIFFFLRLQFF